MSMMNMIIGRALAGLLSTALVVAGSINGVPSATINVNQNTASVVADSETDMPENNYDWQAAAEAEGTVNVKNAKDEHAVTSNTKAVVVQTTGNKQGSNTALVIGNKQGSNAVQNNTNKQASAVQTSNEHNTVTNTVKEQTVVNDTAAKEQAAKEAAERAAKEQAAREATEKAAAEQAAREAAERAAAEQAAREAAEKAAAEQAAREAAEKAAAEQAVIDDEWADSECVSATDVAYDEGVKPAQKVAHYHCNCGHSTTDYNELGSHMLQHVMRGETNSYCTTYE